jgi:cytochrome c oxidase subunit II
VAGRIWAIFFMLAAVVTVAFTAIGPSYGWWFPDDGQAHTTLGKKIDDLFYLILIIVAVTYIGTHIALGYVLWQGAGKPREQKAWFSHGSHALEVIWTIVPAGILLFIALYQMDVWRNYRVKAYFPKNTAAVAEVTARQFEWRIRYPAPGKALQPRPQPDDIYTVNDIRVPAGQPVSISLRTDDVQHAIFVPGLRVKQDAVPGLVIPVWFEVTDTGSYDMVCAELCGWGHYKMKARVVATSEADFETWKREAAAEQSYDGIPKTRAVAANTGAGEE